MTERRVLESWKEIAVYLGRAERTCRSWEHELGLPVHRLDDSPKAHVFAYSDELDRWKEKKVLPGRNRLARRLLGPGEKARFWFLTASALAVLAVVAVLVKPARRADRVSASRSVKSIAVLPFVDLSPGKDQEHLGDGIADIMINALNGVEGLRTPARTAAFYFKEAKATPKEIGRRLKVEWILEGSVQVQENKLRVVATLLSVADGYQLWTERYDRNLADIFAVEDEIARRVVDNLKVKIVGDKGAPLVKPGTQNLEAYNLYLTGRYYKKKGWFTLEQAIGFFEKALEKDPSYAQAYAEIAASYATLGEVGLVRPTEAWPKAKTAALKALEIDSRDPYALGTLSKVKILYDWDFRGAEDDLRRGIKDNPSRSLLHGYYAALLIALARFEEGLAEVETALRLDPLTLELGAIPGGQYYLARKYDLALEALEKRLELDPHNLGTYIQLAQVYLAVGRYAEAAAANQRRREIQGTSSQPDDLEPWNALVYAVAGNRGRAREILAQLEDKYKDAFYPYHLKAWVHTALGEKDEAFYWLEKAFQERTGQLYLLKVHPLADPLRDDPRFTDLLRRIGLEK